MSDHKGDAKAIPLPATMILDLSAMLAKQNTAISLYSKFPFPNRENRPLDAFQQEAWDFLVRNPQETYSRQEILDGKQVVRVAVADTMVVQACVNCHNTIAESPKKDWKLGDVRGVLEITSVIDAELANGAALSRSIIVGAILIGLGLLGIALLVAGSVTRPIEALIGAMQKVAAGNFETVLPGLGRKDEIGRLAGGFNHMVSELGAAREREVEERARTATMQAELTRVARLTTMGRMAASMAHEINQPLAAIVANGNAGLRWLARTPPNFDEARGALDQIVKDGHRASDIIGGIRAIFRKGEERRDSSRRQRTYWRGPTPDARRDSERTNLGSDRTAQRSSQRHGRPNPIAAGLSELDRECRRGDEFRYRPGTSAAYKVRDHAVRRADSSRQIPERASTRKT